MLTGMDDRLAQLLLAIDSMGHDRCFDELRAGTHNGEHSARHRYSTSTFSRAATFLIAFFASKTAFACSWTNP